MLQLTHPSYIKSSDWQKHSDEILTSWRMSSTFLSFMLSRMALAIALVLLIDKFKWCVTKDWRVITGGVAGFETLSLFDWAKSSNKNQLKQTHWHCWNKSLILHKSKLIFFSLGIGRYQSVFSNARISDFKTIKLLTSSLNELPVLLNLKSE